MKGQVIEKQDLTKAVAGEFYPDTEMGCVEYENQFIAWHVRYESSVPTKHRVLVKEVVKNKNIDPNSREICHGYAIINGKREFVTVVKFPK